MATEIAEVDIHIIEEFMNVRSHDLSVLGVALFYGLASVEQELGQVFILLRISASLTRSLRNISK